MKLFRQTSRAVTAIIGLTLALSSRAAEKPSSMTANDLASQLSALRHGVLYVRLKMEIKGTANETLQLQIKERRDTNSSEVVYQVLFPNERKGESVLLQKMANRPATGTVFVPPNTVHPIENLKESLFGSDLSYQDAIDDFFAWDHQAILGTEMVDGVNCSILESKPGRSEHSIYGSVRSWIDVSRLIPLRVEKYDTSDKLLRRVDTARVVRDVGRHYPADLTISGARPGSSTLLDGSRIRRKVIYTDRDFSVEGLKDVTLPRVPAD